MTLQTSDFDYELPAEFIAQSAVEPRDSSRLMVLHRETAHNAPHIEHRIFRDLRDYINPGDVLVLNQTRVIPARLHARKPTGGLIEVLLLEKIMDRRWLAMIGGRNVTPDMRLTLQDANGEPATSLQIVEVRDGSQRVVEFEAPIEPLLDALGEMPLPPYIHTPLSDPERYQTVYAHTPGPVAAPTAGLHFTADLLIALQQHGVEIAYCTLHVGPGTFLPVRAEQLADHTLHAEYAELRAEDAQRINAAKLRGNRVIAVGTTSVRTLETAALRSAGAAGEDVCPWRPVIAIAEHTTLFITPGDRFRVVDAMITNFHLPQSTLLMLVSAFAGRDLIRQAYETAKQTGYRFYSLGDAMLIL